MSAEREANRLRPDNMTGDQIPQVAPVRPQVIMWFRAYCVVLCVLYLAAAGFSLVFFLVDPTTLEMPRVGAYVVGAFLLGLGLVLFVAVLLPLILQPRPWLWTYDLVVICLGMTSACFLPACIPLLIFWLKPEVKSYFGKS